MTTTTATATTTTTRVPALLTDEGYRAANEAFLERWSGDEEPLQTFLTQQVRATHTQASNHNPSQTTTPYEFSVLSIGAGNGDRDAIALATIWKTLCANDSGSSSRTKPPTRLVYTAVEPNAAQMDLLRTKLTELSASDDSLPLDIITRVQTAQDYQYGTNVHHLVLFTHSLYHMPGREADVVRRAFDSLVPHGRAICAISTEQGGIFQLMGSFWNEIDYSRFETGDGGLFGQEKLRSLVEEEQYEHQVVELPNVYIDTADATSALLNFLTQSDMTKVPAELLKRVQQKTKELSGPKNRLPHGSGLVCLVK